MTPLESLNRADAQIESSRIRLIPHLARWEFPNERRVVWLSGVSISAMTILGFWNEGVYFGEDWQHVIFSMAVIVGLCGAIFAQNRWHHLTYLHYFGLKHVEVYSRISQYQWLLLGIAILKYLIEKKEEGMSLELGDCFCRCAENAHQSHEYTVITREDIQNVKRDTSTSYWPRIFDLSITIFSIMGCFNEWNIIEKSTFHGFSALTFIAIITGLYWQIDRVSNRNLSEQITQDEPIRDESIGSTQAIYEIFSSFIEEIKTHPTNLSIQPSPTFGARQLMQGLVINEHFDERIHCLEGEEDIEGFVALIVNPLQRAASTQNRGEKTLNLSEVKTRLQGLYSRITALRH